MSAPTLRLHREEVPPGSARVTALRPYLRPTSGGLYWHQPRSAWVREDGTIATHLWCGQVRYDLRASDFVAKVPDEMRCGTCVGRRLGFDRTDGTVFTPRDPFALPARCPGTTWDDPDARTGMHACNVCLRSVGWGKGGPYGGATGTGIHRPADALLDRFQPCPAHGWRSMSEVAHAWGEVATALRCTKWECTWRSELNA